MEQRAGLVKTFRFEAAHHLPDYVGKCANPHGHSYRLRVTVSALLSLVGRDGILLDFDTLKRAVNDAVIDRYDHKDLNTFFDHPTAELMVQKMWADVQGWFSAHAPSITVEQCELWETETCAAIYPFRSLIHN